MKKLIIGVLLLLTGCSLTIHPMAPKASKSKQVFTSAQKDYINSMCYKNPDIVYFTIAEFEAIRYEIDMKLKDHHGN